MRTSLIAALAAASAAALMTGCSASTATTGHHSAATRPQEVTLHATNLLRFQPATIRVHTGTVRITLIDDGAYPHNLSVPALHATSKTVTGDPGGQRTVVSLTFAKPGRYAFECTYHASAGMRGTIDVVAQ
jgi:plastocyanin